MAISILLHADGFFVSSLHLSNHCLYRPMIVGACTVQDCITERLFSIVAFFVVTVASSDRARSWRNCIEMDIV